LRHEPVLITEKVEGTNLSAVLNADNSMQVCKRSAAVMAPGGTTNKYWAGAQRNGLFTLAERVQEYYAKSLGHKPAITVRAELCGPAIQGNIYKLKDLKAYVFEIWVSGKPVDAELYLELLKLAPEVPSVPVLFHGIPLEQVLDGKSVQVFSNGLSQLNPKQIREGVVIRPMREMEIDGFGRLILKQRSPEYLAKEA
jgi:hypothetical protein